MIHKCHDINEIKQIQLSNFLTKLLTNSAALPDNGAREKCLDDSQVQEINCSTFQLEKVVEPMRS